MPTNTKREEMLARTLPIARKQNESTNVCFCSAIPRTSLDTHCYNCNSLAGTLADFALSIEWEARLDEAKWWEHLVLDCPNDNPDAVDKECMYCERIAELERAK